MKAKRCELRNVTAGRATDGTFSPPGYKTLFLLVVVHIIMLYRLTIKSLSIGLSVESDWLKLVA